MRVRLLDPAKLSIAWEECAAMERLGVVRHSNSAWPSPLHTMLKLDGMFKCHWEWSLPYSSHQPILPGPQFFLELTWCTWCFKLAERACTCLKSKLRRSFLQLFLDELIESARAYVSCLGIGYQLIIHSPILGQDWFSSGITNLTLFKVLPSIPDRWDKREWLGRRTANLKVFQLMLKEPRM